MIFLAVKPPFYLRNGLKIVQFVDGGVKIQYFVQAV